MGSVTHLVCVSKEVTRVVVGVAVLEAERLEKLLGRINADTQTQTQP